MNLKENRIKSEKTRIPVVNVKGLPTFLSRKGTLLKMFVNYEPAYQKINSMEVFMNTL